MPFDQPAPALLVLPAYEEAYVRELFFRLEPAADRQWAEYFFVRTRAVWQIQMAYHVYQNGLQDPLLAAYQKAYVLEHYNRLLPYANAWAASYILQQTPAPWQEYMTTLVSTGFPDSDIDAYIAAVIAAGGTVSRKRSHDLRNYAYAQKNNGSPSAWELTDDLWAYWGENAVQGTISLKRRLPVAFIGTPVFEINNGWRTNGVDNAVNTQFVPATHGIVMTGNNMRVGLFDTSPASNPASSGFNVGANTVSANSRLLYRTTSPSFGLNCSSTVPPVTSGPLPFYASASRNPVGPVFEAFRNGLTRGGPTATPTTMGSVPSTHAVYVGGLNNAGALSNPRLCTTGLLSFGAYQTAAQEYRTYVNTLYLARAVGARTGT